MELHTVAATIKLVQVILTRALTEAFACLPRKLAAVQLAVIASHEVGNRPNRVEPRAVKRRPKPHRLLSEPRRQAREKLLAAGRQRR